MDENLSKIGTSNEPDGELEPSACNNNSEDIASDPHDNGNGCDDTAPKEPTNLDDFEADKNYISYEERVQKALANNPLSPCTRNKSADDKISKYSTYGCIPFFIIGIIITIFDKAKYRSPWSFLLLGLAVAVLAVGAILRYRNNLKCKCSICETQGKTMRSSAILWSVLAVGCFIGFIVFLIINLRA